MKKIFYLLSLLLMPCFIKAQNVGIGTPAPSERLDVNGNINVTGTIKANGVDGAANQVLMKNSIGNLVWGDTYQYKNIATFLSGSGTWVIPDTVTRIIVEVTGAGAGGNIYGGGGGGGYVVGILYVTPATSLSYSVGTGGSGGAGGDGVAGGQSQVTYNSTTFAATGGLTTTFNNTTRIFSSAGGQFVISPTTYRNYIAENGAAGILNKISFEQKSATSFFEISSGGNGGGAGYCRDCTSIGTYYAYDISGASAYKYSLPEASNRLRPGTGGGGYILNSVGGFGGGGGGNNGAIIIHY